MGAGRFFSGGRESAALMAVFLLGAAAFQAGEMPGSRLRTERLTHLHYHKARFFIEEPEDAFTEPPRGRVYFGDDPVTGVGGVEKVEFRYEEDEGRWSAIFPVPWSAPNGFYEFRLPDGTAESFLITTRSPYRFEEPLKVMNLESTRRISRINYPSPAGDEPGYGRMFDWIKYLGGNTLWYLAGQTASYSEGDLEPDFPWLKTNMETLGEFSESAKESGVGFGGWIICYRSFGIASLKPDFYDYSMNLRGSRIVETQGISIGDRRRFNHIKDLARRLNEMENIDYIGLDYIRPTGGGLEMVDRFVSEMRIEVPEGWHEKPLKERMAWLGRIVARIENRDFLITEKWNWWRAHTMSQIILRIRESAEISKPLWAFVLSWELGRQHGQDPVMFTDAGIDVLAIMMYETDTVRFNHLIREWEQGTRGFELNLMPGNQIDWPLHQHTVYPSGPEEFYRRIESSVNHLGDNVKGVFVNDLSRAHGGRRGPYGMNEWLMVSGKALGLARRNPEIEVELRVPERKLNRYESGGVIEVRNISGRKLEDISIEFPIIPGVSITAEETCLPELEPGETAEIKYSISIEAASSRRMGRYMAAIRVLCGGRPYIDYAYLWVEGVPPDPGWGYR